MKAIKADHPSTPVLERLIRAFNQAQTLSYKGRKTHPNGLAGQGNDQGPVTHQNYFLESEGGMNRIRVESSATVLGLSVTTIFIKNEDGIWEVWADEVCEVSKIFANDQLPGVFPFFRLFASLQYPYEVHLSEENHGGAECIVISGELPHAPPANGPDIAKEFTYRVGKVDGVLVSIHERTFAKLSVDLELDKLELNQPLDPALFKLPDKPRIVLSSLEQYMSLRNQAMTKRLMSA